MYGLSVDPSHEVMRADTSELLQTGRMQMAGAKHTCEFREGLVSCGTTREDIQGQWTSLKSHKSCSTNSIRSTNEALASLAPSKTALAESRQRRN